MDYTRRKKRSHNKVIQRHKKPFYLILNLWLLYLIILSSSFISNDTFSYFNDSEQINNSFSASNNFCKDPEYAKKYKDICKCKDNSGLGNGSEQCDQYDDDFGDEDNPGHQETYCPDDPNTPEREVCDDHPNVNDKSNNNALTEEQKKVRNF